MFYSNYCLFSKKLMMDIQKVNIRNMFTMVCVEHHKSALPSCIDRVPTIFTNNGQVLVEEMISRYVEMLASKLSDCTDSKDKEEGAVTRKKSIEDVFSDTASGFSYLGDDSSDPMVGSASFAVFGEDQRIDTPDDDTDANNDTSVNYERYKAGRDADVHIPKPTA